jgi:transmembrane sensor
VNEELFLQLLSRKMAGEASAQELQQLSALLEQNSAWKIFHDNLVEGNTSEPPAGKDKNSTSAQMAYASHEVKMQLSGRFESELPSSLKIPGKKIIPFKAAAILKKWSIVAAAFIIVGLLAYSLSSRLRNSAPNALSQTNEILTARGNKSVIKLSDGTNVRLNAESKLKYTNFSNQNREVVLTGEAYFDVAPDSLHPFSIKADKINIKVLGTAFNVKAYPRDEMIETTLVHGKIEVIFEDRPNEKIILKANEKLIVRKNQVEKLLKPAATPVLPRIQVSNIIPVSINDSLLAETAWLKGKLVFVNERLETIALSLERRFDVDIDFTGERTKNLRYTATFENENVEQALELLSTSKKFSVSREVNKFIIAE